MTEVEFIAAYQDAYYQAREVGLTSWQSQLAADAATDELLDTLEDV